VVAKLSLDNKLAQAAAVYRAILFEHPQNAEVLSLLGMIAYPCRGDEPGAPPRSRKLYQPEMDRRARLAYSALAETLRHSERDRGQHPIGRIGLPGDIADACLFLAERARVHHGTTPDY
jgi:hypothetical protein